MRPLHRKTLRTQLRILAARYARAIPKILTPNRGRGECRVPAHPQPRVQSVESTRVSHHRSATTPGIPARNGFNGFLRALPGDRALLSPSPADIGVPGPIGPTSPSANLTPASRRQDHTTSPSAVSALVRSAACVHRIPPRVRDDRDTPLMRDETAENMDLIWVRHEQKYFCKWLWTGRSTNCLTGKSVDGAFL
jgi:hypothetical protein